MKQTDPHFKLRLPPELKARLEIAAAEAKRSVSAEMVARLEASFEEPETAKQTTMGAFVAVLELFQDPKVAKAAIDHWAQMRPLVGDEVDMEEVAQIARATLTTAEEGTVPVARLKKRPSKASAGQEPKKKS